MACGQNQDCLEISKKYKQEQPDIDSSFDSIKSAIDMVAADLGGLTIPDDYLGEKVKSRIDEIVTSIEASSSEVDAEKAAVDSHIEKYAEIHRKHYNDWKKSQEEDDNDDGEQESNTQVSLEE